MTQFHARPYRICVTGAECTGKTTLATLLGRMIDAPVIREATRSYFAMKSLQGDASVYASDIVRVVELQKALEDGAPSDASTLVFDTDLFTIDVWHEPWLGRRYRQLDQLVDERQRGDRRIDLFVLCTPDFPFEHDAIRTSDAHRMSMHEVFRTALIERGLPYVEVSGSPSNRAQMVLHRLQESIDQDVIAQ